MADVSKIVDELSSLTVLEAAELAKLLKERWQPPKVTLADIKNELPAWPDDVIHQWLHYFANEPDCGWPPPLPLGDHRWSRLLRAVSFRSRIERGFPSTIISKQAPPFADFISFP